MTYGSGTQVILPVTNTAASQATMNAADAELATLLGPQKTAVPLAAMAHDQSGGAGIFWYLRYALGYLAWQNVNAATALYGSLPGLRTGQVITAVDVSVRGTTTGGSIVLMRQSITTPAAPTSVATWAANPWATSGAFAVKSATAGLPHTVLADWHYYLVLTPSAVDPQYVSGATYTAQMGA